MPLKNYVEPDDEDIVVIASARSTGCHRPKPETIAPACNANTKPTSEWRPKEYRFVKGWRKPCEKKACFGHDE